MSTQSDTPLQEVGELHFTNVPEIPEGAPKVQAPETPDPLPLDAEAQRKERRNARDRERKRRKREGLPSLSPTGKRIGRPPGSRNKPKDATPRDPAPTPNKEPDSFAAELDALRSSYSEEPKAMPGADPVNGGAPTEKPFISGYVLLLVVDVLFPMLIGAVMRRDPSKLRLTKEERDQLEPIADRAAMDLLGGMSPVQLFLSVTFAMFIGKASALPKLPKKERDPVNAKR